MIQAILFDIDNTLLDFDACVRQAMRTGFSRFQIGAYEDGMYDMFEQINSGLWRRIEQGTLTLPELHATRWNLVFDALGLSFDGPTFETYFRACLYDSAIPVAGAQPLLSALHSRYSLCAASNGPFEQQRHRLELAGMLPFLAHVFTSESVGAAKPAPAFFSHCLSVLNIDRATRQESALSPAEVLMVGDSLSSDIAGALESGLSTCFFDFYGTGLPDGLAVDHVVRSLAEIPAFL